MNKYLGVKLIEAEPMNLGDYNKFKGWDIPKDEERNKEGYKVKYSDDYISWSPKSAFEVAYKQINGLNFGLAVEGLKKGYRLQRKGWNGKGMWLEAQFPDACSKMTHPYLFMNIPECEEGIRRLPWQPAQVDIFSEDWQVVE